MLKNKGGLIMKNTEGRGIYVGTDALGSEIYEDGKCDETPQWEKEGYNSKESWGVPGARDL